VSYAKAMLDTYPRDFNACGDECERHAEMHEHCGICAEACRACEEACRELLAAMG
jgi:hypothetical protein